MNLEVLVNVHVMKDIEMMVVMIVKPVIGDVLDVRRVNLCVLNVEEIGLTFLYVHVLLEPLTFLMVRTVLGVNNNVMNVKIILSNVLDVLQVD